VCSQEAPAQTAKAIATVTLADQYYGPLALVIAEGLAQRGAGANALAEAIGQAYKQVRSRCMKHILIVMVYWLALD
jgi:hypothetical protein